MTAAPSGPLQLAAALTDLRDALGRVRLPLSIPGAADQEFAARQISQQLDDYVLPRLESIDAPLLAVVGGSTGAGKSTLVNSLIGREVSKPGVIRPTTRSPVLIFNPADEHWFDNERVLPGLARTRVASNDTRSLQLVPEPTLPQGLALVDAPDIDSIDAFNRALAAQLLQAADLWLFVTTAARYADAVPWEFLTAAADRSATVGVVCNRVPPAAMDDVPPDLGRMMTERGLAESPLFAVPETVTDASGLLPDAAVSIIRGWLTDLAADKQSRQRVVLQTLAGAVASLVERAPAIAEAVDAHVAALDRLDSDAAAQFSEAARQVSVQSSDGTLLRGEVLARWQDLVGTSEFTRALDRGVSWVRDRLTRAFRGEPPEGEQTVVAVSSGLEALIVEEGVDACERAEQLWRDSPAGREIMAHADVDLSRPTDDFAAQVARAIRDWQGDVMELVAEEGQGRRSRARVLSLGVTGVGAALMIAVFAGTGGLTGAEVGIGAGTSVIANRLLEAIFGDNAVRNLSQIAKQQLDARVEGVMASQLARFQAMLRGVHARPDVASAIRESIGRINAIRPHVTALDAATPAGELPGKPALQQSPELPAIVDAEIVGDHDE